MLTNADSRKNCATLRHLQQSLQPVMNGNKVFCASGLINTTTNTRHATDGEMVPQHDRERSREKDTHKVVQAQ